MSTLVTLSDQPTTAESVPLREGGKIVHEELLGLLVQRVGLSGVGAAAASFSLASNFGLSYRVSFEAAPLP